MHEKKVCSIPVQQIGGLGSVLFCLARSDALPSGRAKGGGGVLYEKLLNLKSPWTMSRWKEWYITLSATRTQSGVRNIFIYVLNILNTWPSKIWFQLASNDLMLRFGRGILMARSQVVLSLSSRVVWRQAPSTFFFYFRLFRILSPIVIRIYHIILWEQSFVYFANIVPLRAPARWWYIYSILVIHQCYILHINVRTLPNIRKNCVCTW